MALIALAERKIVQPSRDTDANTRSCPNCAGSPAPIRNIPPAAATLVTPEYRRSSAPFIFLSHATSYFGSGTTGTV